MEIDQKLLQRSISGLKKIASPRIKLENRAIKSKSKEQAKTVAKNLVKQHKSTDGKQSENRLPVDLKYINGSNTKIIKNDTTTTNVYLKTIFYVIFGYLALAQIRQEITSLLSSMSTRNTQEAMAMPSHVPSNNNYKPSSLSHKYYRHPYNDKHESTFYDELDLNSEYIMMEQDLQMQQKYHINYVNMVHTYNVNNYHVDNDDRNLEELAKDDVAGGIPSTGIRTNSNKLYLLNNLKRIIVEQQARINNGGRITTDTHDNTRNNDLHIKIRRHNSDKDRYNTLYQKANNNFGEKNTDNNLADLPEVYSTYSNQWVSTGSQVIFKVNVKWPMENMDQKLYFQWRRNGVDIPGAVGHLMILNAVTIKDEGTYTCAVSNEKSNTVIWEESVLHVASPPKVKLEFVKVVVQKGDSVSLSVNLLSGTPPPKFQWRINGVDIPGAISETYTVLSASTNDVGTYTCMVANLAGSIVWEENILLLEGLNPLIKKHTKKTPIDVHVEKGKVKIKI
jgi:hypothetical protein